MSWFHDLTIAVIVSGIPTAVLGRWIQQTHRQTKTSNGTTLARLVEKQGEIIGTMKVDQLTMKEDIGAIAVHVGLTERERLVERERQRRSKAPPIARRLP